MADYENERIAQGLPPEPTEEELQQIDIPEQPWANLTVTELRPYLVRLGINERRLKTKILEQVEGILGPGIRPLDEVPELAGPQGKLESATPDAAELQHGMEGWADLEYVEQDDGVERLGVDHLQVGQQQAGGPVGCLSGFQAQVHTAPPSTRQVMDRYDARGPERGLRG